MLNRNRKNIWNTYRIKDTVHLLLAMGTSGMYPICGVGPKPLPQAWNVNGCLAANHWFPFPSHIGGFQANDTLKIRIKIRIRIILRKEK